MHSLDFSLVWHLRNSLYFLSQRVYKFICFAQQMCIYTLEPLRKILPCVAFAFPIFGRGVLWCLDLRVLVLCGKMLKVQSRWGKWKEETEGKGPEGPPLPPSPANTEAAALGFQARGSSAWTPLSSSQLLKPRLTELGLLSRPLSCLKIAWDWHCKDTR